MESQSIKPNKPHRHTTTSSHSDQGLAPGLDKSLKGNVNTAYSLNEFYNWFALAYNFAYDYNQRMMVRKLPVTESHNIHPSI